MWSILRNGIYLYVYETAWCSCNYKLVFKYRKDLTITEYYFKRRMKKTILFLLMFFASVSMSVSAQNTVIVHQKDGKTVSFGLPEKPVITYADNEMVITTTKTVLQYPLASVSQLTFSDDETSVAPVADEKQAPVLELDNYVVRITGADAEASVTVVASDGKTLILTKVNSDGTATFSVAELPEGIYIIKSENLTFKILKK